MRALIVGKQKATFMVAINGSVSLVKPSGNLIKSRNLIYVGDYVELDDTLKVAVALHERKNFLIRPPLANVDILLIVMSLMNPSFSSFLVDKFLSYAHFAEVKPIVVITKPDLLVDQSVLENAVSSLTKLGVTYVIVNNKTKEGLETLLPLLDQKIVALMGQSGVGKSSFINNLTLEQRIVGEVDNNINRGRHVTKEVVMLPLNDGYIVDTPGFSSFDLPLTKGDLAENFPGFKRYLGKCKFNNCLHLSEQGCAVKNAIKLGDISEESYLNYATISNELKLVSEDYK